MSQPSGTDVTNVAGFWRWFEGQADTLAEVVAGRRHANITQMMDAALTEHGLPLTYEISAGVDGPELIFSAEGREDWASFLTEMVEKAPATGWTIHPSRPRRPLEVALSIVREVYGVDLTDSRLQARVVDDRFHLRFLDDQLYRLADNVRHDAAALFLDYALGERLATATVAGLDFQPGGDGIAIPLMLNELIRKAESAGSVSAVEPDQH